MIELETKTRKWGNSIGILLPKRYGIKVDQDVCLHIAPAKKYTKVKDIFGLVKFKKSTKQLMKEIDLELDF